jgi:uncharacterized delta-60 repeat protein
MLEYLERRDLLTNWVLDPTYGFPVSQPDGRAYHTPPAATCGSQTGEARGMALQPDGKLLLSGFCNQGGGVYDVAILRLLTNGRPDPDFGVNGWSIVSLTPVANEKINALTVDEDTGKIYAVGDYQPQGENGVAFVAAFLPNGNVDTSFGGHNGDDPGEVTIVFKKPDGTPMYRGRDLAVSLQEDGRIVVAGQADFNDPTASSTGEWFAVARLRPNGTFDPSFGTNPATPGRIVFTAHTGNSARDMILLEPDGQGNQSILLAGRDMETSAADNNFAVVRLLHTGALDPTFGNSDVPGVSIVGFTSSGGGARGDLAWGMTLQQIGLQTFIVVAGESKTAQFQGSFAATRLTFDGAIDTSFATNGRLLFDAGVGWNVGRDVAVQPEPFGGLEQKLVFMGFTSPPDYFDPAKPYFSGARYNQNGTVQEGIIESVFPEEAGHIDEAWRVLIDGEEKIVAGGMHAAGYGVIRACQNPDGINCNPPGAAPGGGSSAGGPEGGGMLVWMPPDASMLHYAGSVPVADEPAPSPEVENGPLLLLLDEPERSQAESPEFVPPQALTNVTNVTTDSVYSSDVASVAGLLEWDQDFLS